MIQLATLALPDGLAWPDEFDTRDIGQAVRQRLDGGVVIYPRKLSAGRPITLIAPADQPITRAQGQALASLAAVPGEVYALSLRGTTFAVMFRHHDAPALDLAPLIDYSDPIDEDYLVGQIKLFTV